MIERVFLGSGSSLLPAVASWIVDRHRKADEGVIDCRGHVVVLPTGRAGRLLEARLLDSAREFHVIPPAMLTPAALLDRFLIPSRTLADSLAHQTAWLEVIRSTDVARLQTVTGHQTPPTDREAVVLAVRLHQLLDELGAAGLSPEEVVEVADTRGLPIDDRRWEALARMWSQVNEILKHWNLVDQGVARIRALEAAKLPCEDVTQVSIISADPSPIVKRLLHQLDEQGVLVQTIIHGLKSDLEHSFDQYGDVNLDVWSARPIPLDEAELRRCERVDDQAYVILDYLADQSAGEGELNPNHWTIVLPDEDVAAETLRVLRKHDVPMALDIGPAPRAGQIGLFLQVLADILEDESATLLGDLIRHPDVESWLEQQGCPQPVATWDQLWSRHLPRSLPSLGSGSPAAQRYAPLLDPVLELLEPLRGGPRPLSEWIVVLMEAVATIMNPALDSLSETDRGVIDDLRELTESQLDRTSTAVVESSVACRFVFESLSARPRWVNAASGVAVVGWLDAHLDDAPELVLTGLNEGILPESPTVDHWLPEALRDALGLSSQRRRMARDAWLLYAILQSGRRVVLMTAQRNARGTPLPPSRLLLRSSGLDLATRVRELVSSPVNTSAIRDWKRRPRHASGFKENPLPEGRPVIEYVTVTSFRRFIEDPYAFLIERDQRIRSREITRLSSLDHASFGSMIHSVLESWGREEQQRPRRTEHAGQIEKELLAELDQYQRRVFGDQPLPGLRVQFAIAAYRLRAAAEVQAERARQGWKIHLVEKTFDRLQAPWFPDSTGLPLHGKIDRIDVNMDGCFQALDYKTGKAIETPEAVHQGRSGWKDLQLPLYQFLLASVDIPVAADGLGYFMIPADRSSCGVSMASWTMDDLEDAFDQAAEIIEILTGSDLIAEVEDRL